MLTGQPGQAQQELPFFLTGSQRKTAYALRRNCEDMIAGNAPRRLVETEYKVGTDTHTTKAWLADKPENLNCIGFLTLTVGNVEDGRFRQVFDAKEASRRIDNLNRRVLPDLFEKAIIVTERHANGAIHFHILGILRNRPDIRTGLDFEAVANRDYRSASPALRAIWEHLRDVLPRYGFGRAELLPVKKTGEAVACYVSKYIEKNICNRIKEDKRKKLVRYIGWDKKQLKPNEFSWGTKRATAWRLKTREAAATVNVTCPRAASESFGPRWAFHISRVWQRLDENLFPGLTCGESGKIIIRAALAKQMGSAQWRENFVRTLPNRILGEFYGEKEMQRWQRALNLRN